MKTMVKKVKFTVRGGALCRCPLCRRVNVLRSDPQWWQSRGMDPAVTCRHLLEVGWPRYVDEGEATFVFNTTYKAA